MKRSVLLQLATVAALSLMATQTHAACSSPTGDEGALAYASNLGTLVYCDGTDWTTLNGNSGTSGATTLDGLSDVDTTGAATGKLLAYDGTNWVVSDSVAVPTVDGAGSANHVAYWSDADTLTYDSSQLYWNATTNWLGIGTSTPGAMLSVAGDISTSTEMYVGDGTASAPSHSFMNDTNTGLYGAAADVLAFTAGGTDRARITSAGISTTGVVIAGSTISGTLFYSGAGAAATPAHTFFHDADTGLYSITANTVGVATGGTERVRIDGSGNVSTTGVIDVGHTALACSTTISGSVRYEVTSDTLQICTGSGWKSLSSETIAAATVDGAGSANHVAYWSDANTLTYDLSKLYWDATNDRLGVNMALPQANLQVSGSFIVSTSAQTTTPSLYVNTSGNVGIGTSAPSYLVHVSGTSSGGGIHIGLQNVGSNGNAWFLSRNDAQTWMSGVNGGASDAYQIYDSVAGARLTVDTSGNVGIGTATPGAMLSVAGDISTSTEIYAGDGTASAPSHSFMNDTNTGLYGAAADVLAFTAGGTDRARITSAGISTTGVVIAGSTISGTLFYSGAGAAATPAYTFSHDTNTGLYSAGADILAFATGGTERVRISSGIISTTGVVNAGSAIYTSGSSGGFFAYDRTTGVLNSGLYRTGNITSLWDSTAGDVISYNTSGNVGIGTTSPAATLDVSGAIVTRGFSAGSGTSIDFSQSNVVYTTAACGAFTLSNMQNGGAYTLVTTGSGTGPATFTHTGLTVKTTGTLTCTSAKHTVFSFVRAGSNVYVTMITGY